MLNNLKLIFLSLLIVSSASCKKDEDEKNNNTTQNNAPAPTTTELKATINGEEWIAKPESINGNHVSAFGGSTITIDGENEDGSSISISLSLWNNSPGTYEVTQVGLSNYVGLNYQNENSVNFSAPTQNSNTSGSLTIAYWNDNKVSGSFNFVGGQDNSNNTITVSNGIFSILNVN